MCESIFNMYVKLCVFLLMAASGLCITSPCSDCGLTHRQTHKTLRICVDLQITYVRSKVVRRLVDNPLG